MKDVEKFDPSTLMQGVKDRIKATFVSLIPDDQWEQMVKVEIDHFFLKQDLGWSSSKEKASNFQILVRDVINEEAKRRLKEYLCSSEFMVTWNGNGLPVATKAVKDMMVENSGAILANFYAGIFASMLQQFSHNLTVR